MTNTAKYWIDKLQLLKHPEGGWFREIYRSQELIPRNALPDFYSGDRNISTSIYYLLEKKDVSAFHRIRSDEIWHFYTGTSAIEIVTIQNREIKKYYLCNNAENGQLFQLVVPKNTWFAARLLNTNGFALVGCTVSPGFHFDDFEMADGSLLSEFPNLQNEISPLLK
jgi:predicted cupin superfamily sugar epimerase